MHQKINFIDLQERELALVLAWRNHPKIAQWMLTQHHITPKEHQQFIKSLRETPDKDYFLVQDDEGYMGVIDLTGHILGLYANPDRQRMGDPLLEELIHHAFAIKKLPLIQAKVFKKNSKAIKLYERFGFSLTHTEENLLTLELKNENWHL
jgi:UDP-4-amino-4,6-dideoxy-N-acetyl-beta-L-altrosamine N-acetyltransferase